MSSRPSRGRAGAWVIRLAPLLAGTVLGGILLVLLLRSVSWTHLRGAIAGTDVSYLVLAILPFCAIVYVKVVRWGLLFGGASPGFHTLFGALNTGYAVNTVAPLRLGELVGAYWIREHAGVPMIQSLSTIALERVSDGLAVLILLVVTAPTVAFPASLVVPAVSVGAALSAAMVVMALLVYASSRERQLLDRFLARFQTGRGAGVVAMIHQALEGLQALRDLRAMLLFSMYTAVIWICNALLMWLIVRAFHLEVPILAGFLLAAVLNLGMAVPSSPGYVGVYDYLMVVTLGLYGEPRAASLAAAFAAHAINFLPVTVVGLVYLGRHGLASSFRLLTPGSRSTG